MGRRIHFSVDACQLCVSYLYRSEIRDSTCAGHCLCDFIESALYSSDYIFLLITHFNIRVTQKHFNKMINTKRFRLTSDLMNIFNLRYYYPITNYIISNPELTPDIANNDPEFILKRIHKSQFNRIFPYIQTYFPDHNLTTLLEGTGTFTGDIPASYIEIAYKLLSNDLFIKNIILTGVIMIINWEYICQFILAHNINITDIFRKYSNEFYDYFIKLVLCGLIKRETALYHFLISCNLSPEFLIPLIPHDKHKNELSLDYLNNFELCLDNYDHLRMWIERSVRHRIFRRKLINHCKKVSVSLLERFTHDVTVSVKSCRFVLAIYMHKSLSYYLSVLPLDIVDIIATII